MSIFGNIFKAVGKAASFVGKVASPLAKPLLSVAAGFIPGVGPLASSLVNKLLPDAPAPAQQVAMEAITQAAAAPPVTPAAAIDQAAQLKQTLVGMGVPAAAASSVGAVAKVASEAAPEHAAATLQLTNSNLPTAPLQNGFTKEDVKVIVNGALDGARNGAADAYLDKTADGKATKSAAIESQGQKILPYVFLAVLGLVFFTKRK
jgi:hypothetical protein